MQGLSNSQIEDILVTYSYQKKFDSPWIKAKFVYESILSNTALAKEGAEDHIWLIEKETKQLVKLKNKTKNKLISWPGDNVSVLSFLLLQTASVLSKMTLSTTLMSLQLKWEGKKKG